MAQNGKISLKASQKQQWFTTNAKYGWVNNFGRVVSKQHLYEHTEHIQCFEVTHSPEADIVAFHIPPTVTMSCQLFPSKAVESLLLCVCWLRWNLGELSRTAMCIQYSYFLRFNCLSDYWSVSVRVNSGREGMVFVCLLPSHPPPGSADIRK